MAEAFPVNDEGWPLCPDGYRIVVEVGKGAFATVVNAVCPSKGDAEVAIKIMSLENITTSLEEIQSEVKTMKLSRHENVLDLLCCFVVKQQLWLVMPLMDKGSCYYVLRMLRKTKKVVDGQGMAEDCIATIMKGLLEGLDYLHGHGQIHRDVKAGNVLLNSEGRVAIADFGVAGWMSITGDKKAGDGGGACKTFVGTPCWMAPEVMAQTSGYNQSADIWSVGITALELLKGYAPYAKYAPMQVLIKTIREAPPSVKSYGEAAGVTMPSERFSKFVARCLQKDPRLRPSAHELLTDPFVKRALKSAKFAEVLLADIPAVGSEDAVKLEDVRPASAQPFFAVKGKAESFVPGTTWVFPDEVGVGGGGTGEADDTLEAMMAGISALEMYTPDGGVPIAGIHGSASGLGIDYSAGSAYDPAGMGMGMGMGAGGAGAGAPSIATHM